MAKAEATTKTKKTVTKKRTKKNGKSKGKAVRKKK